MSDKNDSIEYDEDDAVKYIQKYLPQEMNGKFSDDDINYIIDIVYDFYESKGLMDEIDDDTTIDIDEDEMIQYILKYTKKDKVNNFSEEDIAIIVQGELAYCESIGIFE